MIKKRSLRGNSGKENKLERELQGKWKLWGQGRDGGWD